MLLLNRVPSVQPGMASASHRGQGWEEVTGQAIKALAARDTPLVAILWGGMPATSLRSCVVSRSSSRHTREPHVGGPGLLRLPPVQPRQPTLERHGGQPIDWKLP